MEKIKQSGLLKIVCYILIPILVAILCLSVLHLIFLSEYSEIEDEKEYIKTDQFAESYFEYILYEMSDCEKVKNGKINITNFYKIEEDNGNWYYYSNKKENTSYYNGISLYIDFIIINEKTGTMYTNIKSQDYQKEIENINKNNLYWKLEDGKIDTNIEKLNQDNIKYNSQYIILKSNENREYDYKIYTYSNEKNVNKFTAYGISKQLYQFMMQHQTSPIYALIISIILLVVISIYLFLAIGYKKGVEGIDLNAIDRIPYEIIFLICLTIVAISSNFLANMNIIVDYIVFIVGTISYFICYIACAVMGVTTIKRIKAKKFLKSFITYKILKWIFDKIKKYNKVVLTKAVGKRRLFWYYWGFIIISVILESSIGTGIGILLLIAFWLWTYYKIRDYQNKEQTIKKALQEIYEGKTDIYIEEQELKGILKQMAIYINDIAGGFSNAIEESLKSERLKTELITNVSHDIKTPLTSIINYVDLLKKEEIQDEKVKEYIEILDKKSQRLKKLTEDLVEASKVSSGNVTLNMEKINFKELLNQTIGEFKDKFEQKELSIEVQFPENEVIIEADSRYMYRIIENLFSNITKYAVENSRVYIDMQENNNDIKISMKNISKEKLNISSDELMQRFVRGDKSRYTEGSGLGLSIAQSLTLLQKGKFDIIIDGDLFKVEMTWEKKL